jgi:cytochrome P450
MAVTLAIISKTMFDADVTDDSEAIYEAVNTVIRYSERYMNPTVGRMFDALPLPSTKRVHHAERTLNEIIYRFIREHREAAEDKGDLLSMLLMAQAEDGSGVMSDQQVRDECITLFLAGHETTSIAMSWTFYLLSQHPEIEAKLHAEVDTVLEGGRPATAEDVRKLEYTRRVLAESMRIFPPAPAFGRQAVRDTTVGPYAIHKGDVVLVAAMAMQRQARWFPEPDRFDPDRWAPELAAERPKFSYFPFGGGVRKCIGEPFAWMEGILLLASFAQQWRFDLAPDAKIGMDPKITLRPRYGMQMIARRR